MLRGIRAIVTTILIVLPLAGFRGCDDGRDGAPFDHTYDLTPVKLAVGTQDFLVPRAYMSLSNPKTLYIEALLPGADAISEQNDDCFRHINICKDIVWVLYTSQSSLPPFHQDEVNMHLNLERRVYDKQLDLEQYFRANGTSYPYFRAVDGTSDILITCVTDDKGQLTYQCTSSEHFLGEVLKISFRPEKLSEWRSIRRAVMARLASFKTN